MVKISVIIPVLNEAARLEKTILNLEANSDTEIIVVDGGSQDKTVELTKMLGVKLICYSSAHRAQQLNLGAQSARGEILLFLHGDTLLPDGYQDMVKKALSEPEIIAGAFELSIEGQMPSLRFIEKMVNWRSRFFSLPYGDQGIFLNASIFKQIGGFSDFPIMEDFELVQRLKSQGKITIIPAQVITSGRRWQRLGIWQTTLINQLIVIGYFLGVPPLQLAKWYRK